jgi:hypothetical protein
VARLLWQDDVEQISARRRNRSSPTCCRASIARPNRNIPRIKRPGAHGWTGVAGVYRASESHRAP